MALIGREQLKKISLNRCWVWWLQTDRNWIICDNITSRIGILSRSLQCTHCITLSLSHSLGFGSCLAIVSLLRHEPQDRSKTWQERLGGGGEIIQLLLVNLKAPHSKAWPHSTWPACIIQTRITVWMPVALMTGATDVRGIFQRFYFELFHSVSSELRRKLECFGN